MFLQQPRRLVYIAGLLFALSTCAFSQAIQDFTFIHGSDSHAPQQGSDATIAQIATLGPVQMANYGVSSSPPAFVIMTGDITEFGPYLGALDTYVSWWKDVKVPVYNQSGNHDGTWYCIRRALRRWYGGVSYSFDYGGCHFVGLDSSGLQDPRPGFTREQLLWLEDDLRKTGKAKPVFVFFHHPLPGKEFASAYDYDRLLDVLHPYNVVLLMAGHSHGSVHSVIDGYDLVTGGSTFGPNAGFSVISIQNETLRVAYRKAGEAQAAKPLLEKKLPAKGDYPVITVGGLKDGMVVRGDMLPITAAISGNKSAIVSAGYALDGIDAGDFTLEMGRYKDSIPLQSLKPGAHSIQVKFTDEAGRTYQESAHFYVESGPTQALWRYMAGGSCKTTPAVTADAVYVGGTDGKLYALKRANGELLWSFKTGGEILTQPLVLGDTIYFGSGDAKFYAVGKDGKQKWFFQAGGPVYSSPVASGDLVIFGCNDSKVYALDARTGKQVWVNDDPAYTIESKPFVDGDAVYFGAWDTFVYAVDVKTGLTKWKCVGKGSSMPGPARYYSPADCGPVVAGGKVFIADRMYWLSIIDAATGQMVGEREKVAGVGIAEDGKSVYLRGTDGKLTKIDAEGKDIWSVDAKLGFIPTAPTERNGVVYVCTGDGLAEAFSAADGTQIWSYRATPEIFVMSSMEAAEGIAYVTGMDGSVTAIKGAASGTQQ